MIFHRSPAGVYYDIVTPRRFLMTVALLALACSPGLAANPRKATSRPARPTAELLADLRADDPETQLPAMMELIRRREKTAAAALASCLDSPAPRIRLLATIGLGSLQAQPYARDVMNRLADSDPLVRAAALVALVRVNPTPPLTPMIPMLDDPSDLVRAGACRVFVRMKEKRLLPNIRRKLSDPSPFVRYQALRAMVELRSPAAPGEVEKKLTDDDAAIRYEAARLLGLINARQAMGSLHRSAFGDQDQDVQLAALTAMGKLMDARQYKKVVLSLFRQDPPDQNPPAGPRGMKSWKQIDREIRWRGRRLAALGPGAMRWMLLALQDKDSTVRQTALVALKSIGDGRALVYIKPLLVSPDKNEAARAKAAYDTIKERAKAK